MRSLPVSSCTSHLCTSFSDSRVGAVVVIAVGHGSGDPNARDMNGQNLTLTGQATGTRPAGSSTDFVPMLSFVIEEKGIDDEIFIH